MNTSNKNKKQCPKCKSYFGLRLVEASNKIICFHGNCDWFATLDEWNKKNPDNKFLSNEIKRKI